MNDVGSAIELFHFLRPWWLLALPVGLVVIWLIKNKNDSSNWDDHISPHLLKVLLYSPDNKHRISPLKLGIATLLLWTLALAGPTWEKEQSPLVDDTSPLVIAIYLSNTLNNTDLLPNRLTHIKYKLSELLNKRQGAQTGLVVYDGTAHSVLPLTEDTEILNLYLRELETELIPKSPSSYRTDLALQKSEDLFKSISLEQQGSVIVVTDDLFNFSNSLNGYDVSASSTSITLFNIDISIEQNSNNKIQSSIGIPSIDITIDDSDVNHLLNEIDRQWQAQMNKNNNLRWRDFGQYLLWVLLPIMLLWFRKGMVLQ